MSNQEKEPKILPFQPEGLPAMRARYEDAIKPLYSVERIRHLHLESPGAKRKHVFDHKAGIRIVITREHAPLDDDPKLRDPIIHLGAKMMEGKASLNGKQVPIGEVIRTFLYISKTDNKVEPVHSHISQNGVLHILFPSPIKEEYDLEVPMNAILEHERHLKFGVSGEEKTIAGHAFDPRLHCSICSEKRQNKTE